ncbi:TIGR02234 family membrane protein [Streptacidiphilus monticola]
MAVMLGATLLGATLLLVAAGQTWQSGEVSAQGATRAVSVSGHDVSGIPGALALVGLAATVGVFAVRGRARTVMGLLVALAGAVSAGVAVSVLAGGFGAALDEKAARTIGLAEATAQHVTGTAWPLVTLAGGLLVLAAGLLTTRQGARWPGMSARYDAPVRAAAKGAPARPAETPADLWKALDRGEDPTAG